MQSTSAVALALFVANLVAWNYMALMTHLGGLRLTSCRANAALVCLALLLPIVIAPIVLTRDPRGRPRVAAGHRVLAVLLWLGFHLTASVALAVAFAPVLLAALSAGNDLARATGIAALAFVPSLAHGALVAAQWRVRRPSETFGRWFVLACGWITPTLLLPWAFLGLVVGVDHDLQDGESYTGRVPTTANSYCTLRLVAFGRRGEKELRLLAVTEFLPGLEWWRWATTEPPLPPNVGALQYDGGDLVEQHPDGPPIRYRLR